jgi:hypothetical protein
MVLEVDVSGAVPASEPALAGLELGWRQLLDNLEQEVRDPPATC